jgi:hypothetical protein
MLCHMSTEGSAVCGEGRLVGVSRGERIAARRMCRRFSTVGGFAVEAFSKMGRWCIRNRAVVCKEVHFNVFWSSCLHCWRRSLKFLVGTARLAACVLRFWFCPLLSSISQILCQKSSFPNLAVFVGRERLFAESSGFVCCRENKDGGHETAAKLYENLGEIYGEK